MILGPNRPWSCLLLWYNMHGMFWRKNICFWCDAFREDYTVQSICLCVTFRYLRLLSSSCFLVCHVIVRSTNSNINDTVGQIVSTQTSCLHAPKLVHSISCLYKLELLAQCDLFRNRSASVVLYCRVAPWDPYLPNMCTRFMLDCAKYQERPLLIQVELTISLIPGVVHRQD